MLWDNWLYYKFVPGGFCEPSTLGFYIGGSPLIVNDENINHKEGGHFDPLQLMG